MTTTHSGIISRFGKNSQYCIPHIHKSFCTLYMSTASLRTLQMVRELRLPLYIFCFVVVSSGLLSDITSFNLQTESNSLIEHNVSAA